MGLNSRMNDDGSNALGGALAAIESAAGRGFAAGTQAIDAGIDSAGTVDIATGLSGTVVPIVQLVDAGSNVVTGDIDVTVSGGTITVADGSSKSLAAGESLRWMAIRTG